MITQKLCRICGCPIGKDDSRGIRWYHFPPNNPVHTAVPSLEEAPFDMISRSALIEFLETTLTRARAKQVDTECIIGGDIIKGLNQTWNNGAAAVIEAIKQF